MKALLFTLIACYFSVTTASSCYHQRVHVSHRHQNIQCSDGYAMKGIHRNKVDNLRGITHLLCCKLPGVGKIHNHKKNWVRSFDVKGWSTCNNDGWFMKGFRKSVHYNLYNIEYGLCVRRSKKYQSCYTEKSVVHTLDRKGWSKCKKSGYFMTGMWRNGHNKNDRNRNKLHRIEYFKCCKPKNLKIKPRSGCLNLFQHSNYRGNKWSICNTRSFEQFFKKGSRNDEVSSFCAGEEANWRLFEHNFTGSSFFIKAGRCGNIPRWFNDKSSSVLKEIASRNTFIRQRRPFYVIGHMANDRGLVKKFLNWGANAIEIDLTLSKNGDPQKFYHGYPCDDQWLCHKESSISGLLLYFSSSFVLKRCVLLIIDLKLGDVKSNKLEKAGRIFGSQMVRYFFKKNNMRAVFSVPENSHVKFFKGLMKTAGKYKHRFSLDVSMEKNIRSAVSHARKYSKGAAIWYSYGLSALLNLFSPKYDVMRSAVKYRDSNRNSKTHPFSKVWYWTGDRVLMIRKLLSYSVDGICTNKPKRLHGIVTSRKFRNDFVLATKNDNPFKKFFRPWYKKRYYRITIKTGSLFKSGTDSNIWVQIRGTKGVTSWKRLNGLIRGNAFERNDKDTVRVHLADVGKITSVRFDSDGKYAGSKWNLEYVQIGSKRGFYRRWLSRGKTSWIKMKNLKSYRIVVKTGNKWGAGTDSNIYIRMKGSKGETGWVRLNGYIRGNAFERRDTDRLTVTMEDIGNVSSFRLRSDGKWAGSSWYCSWIKVNGKRSSINRWINKGSTGWYRL